jgi:hypothetical protein
MVLESLGFLGVIEIFSGKDTAFPSEVTVMEIRF